MVTVQQVAEKTGVSTKTLSRWVAKGALPKPVIQTHSSGRGKEGVWPDQVLERCQRLAELRRNGHSLESAVATLETDRIRERLATLDGWTVADVLEGKSFDLPDGTKVKALQFLVSMIGKALKQSVVDRDCQQQILGELRHNNLVRAAVNMAAGGYNPVLTFDGRDTRIEPDFLLSQIHDAGGAMTRSIFMLPLWPTIHEFATAIGIGSHFPEPCVTPAPKVWVKTADEMVEYIYVLGGGQGFQILRPTAAIVATTIPHQSQERTDAPSSP